MHTTPPSTPVLIIGAGPVGLTLACELARHGVANVRIVEKRAAPTVHSNAVVVHVRTQEALDAMGTHAPFATRGYAGGEFVLTAFGHQLPTVRIDGVDSPHPGPLFLPQSETEHILEAHLAFLGGRVERSTEAVHVEPDAAGVAVTLRHLPDGAEETVRAAWVVGCDGPGSITRQNTGIPFEGDRYAGEEFLMGDFTLRWGRPPGRIQAFIEHERSLMIFPMDARGDFTRVLCARLDQDPANKAAPTLAELQTIVREMTGDPTATLTNEQWRTRWRAQHRLAGRLRAGRCLLAGDAGHVHPPVGGQGMNYGIQDAFNLGWKLAAVAKGEASETLLDAYASERHATAQALVSGADQGYHAAIHPGAFTSFVIRHVMPVALSLDAVQKRVRAIMAEFNVAYADSPLTADHGGHAGPKAGQRAPDCPVVHAATLEPAHCFDLLRGTHWTLLLFTGENATPDTCRHLLEAMPPAIATRLHAHLVLRASLPDFVPPAGALLDYGGDLHARYGVAKTPALCLVRPDWYLGFRATLDDAAKLRAYLVDRAHIV